MARTLKSSQPAASLADILERVLDKGVVIAGDIKVKLVDIELLTIQVRLVVCSVDKAMEMGMNWWTHNPDLVRSQARPALEGPMGQSDDLDGSEMLDRMAKVGQHLAESR